MPYDAVASNICRAPTQILPTTSSRRVLNTRFLSYLATYEYDVVRDTCDGPYPMELVHFVRQVRLACRRRVLGPAGGSLGVFSGCLGGVEGVFRGCLGVV